jgi:hypothetical protein
MTAMADGKKEHIACRSPTVDPLFVPSTQRQHKLGPRAEMADDAQQQRLVRRALRDLGSAMSLKAKAKAAAGLGELAEAGHAEAIAAAGGVPQLLASLRSPAEGLQIAGAVALRTMAADPGTALQIDASGVGGCISTILRGGRPSRELWKRLAKLLRGLYIGGCACALG